MKNFFLFFLLISAASFNPIIAQQAPLWDSLKMGKYKIGFKVIDIEDTSRTYSIGLNDRVVENRQFEIRMWYPAKLSPGASQMNYGEYLNFSENHPSLTTSLLSGRSLQTIKSLLDHDPIRIAKLMETPVPAYANATPEEGEFPLLVYSMGLLDGWDENIVLWEYLASKGYVVLVSPSLGYNSLRLAFDQANLETATRDMEILIEEGKQLPFVDKESIGAFGFSYGGQVALYLAMRNESVDAVVGIDPSFSHKTYLKTLTSAPFYNLNMKTPLLHIYNSYADSDLSVVDSLKYAEQERLSFHNNIVGHVDFVSYTLSMTHTLPDSLKLKRQIKTDAYKLVCKKVGEFFDLHLKEKFGGGVESQMSDTLKTNTKVENYKAVPLAPSTSGLMNLLYKKGIIEWEKEMKRISTEKPSASVLEVPAITSMSYELISVGKFDDALKVLSFGTSLHPQSAVLYDYIAEAYVRMNDKKRAIEAYYYLLNLAENDPYINEERKNRIMETTKKTLEELGEKIKGTKF